MPQNGSKGSWAGGARPADGNGVFKFSEPHTLPDGRQVTEIQFKNGAPNFDAYVEGGKHELWQVTGDVKKDGDALRDQMRETNPKWQPPDADEFTPNHFEDGSVGYVSQVIHDRTGEGVAHTGGNSMTNNPLFQALMFNITPQMEQAWRDLPKPKATAVDIATIEGTLGIKLPASYVDFVSRYGFVVFGRDDEGRCMFRYTIDGAAGKETREGDISFMLRTDKLLQIQQYMTTTESPDDETRR